MIRIFQLFIAVVLLPVVCLGFLGEKTSLRSQRRVQNSPSLIQVDEATDTQGVVRHVKWSGPSHPQFDQTLGDCYQQLKSELQKKARARGPAVIQASNDKCSISMGGRLGQVHGEADLK